MSFVRCSVCLAEIGVPCTGGRKHSDRESRENGLAFYYGHVKNEEGERVHTAAPNFQLAPFTGFNAHGAMAELIDQCSGTLNPGRPEAWQRGYDADPKTYNQAAAIALNTVDGRVFADKRGLLAQRFLEAMPQLGTGNPAFYQKAFLLNTDEYPMRDTIRFQIAQWIVAEQITPQLFFQFWETFPSGEKASLDIGDGYVTSDELKAITQLGGNLAYVPLVREGYTAAQVCEFLKNGIRDTETIRRAIIGNVPLEYVISA